MALFDFKSNNHFVASSDGANLQIYELTNHTVNLPLIKKIHWKKVATIQTSHDEDDDNDDEMSYNGLIFFDGHGRIEEEEEFTMLAQHLKDLHLLVSPEGYCFQEVSDLGVYSDYGIDYLRLNDLFSWPRYRVELATTNVWSRSELKYHLPRHKKHSEPAIGGAVISKEKYEELKRSVKEKDEELEKLKELKKKKDDEEAKTKRRIEELEKANKAKDEELKECGRKSWAILPSTKFLPQSLEAKDKYLATRRRVPPGTFTCYSQWGFPYVSNSQKLVDKMMVMSNYGVRVVEEENSLTEWPPLPTIRVCLEDFDKNNWWYLKTTHPEGGLTMLVYYEGNRSHISHSGYGGIDPIIPLPFPKGILEVYSYYPTFSLFRLEPFGVRFGFAYRA